MSRINTIMESNYRQYPFELVIEKRGRFVMNSQTFKEYSDEHCLNGRTFHKYLENRNLMVSENSNGSYTITAKRN